MKFTSVIAGFLAVYLTVTPCFASSHDTNEVNTHDNGAHSHDNTKHHDSDGDQGEEEHCCSEPHLIAPVVSAYTVISTAILPTSTYDVYYNSARQTLQQSYLSRDGPLFERASEHAKTIVIRS